MSHFAGLVLSVPCPRSLPAVVRPSLSAYRPVAAFTMRTVVVPPAPMPQEISGQPAHSLIGSGPPTR